MVKKYLVPCYILCFIKLMVMTIIGGGKNYVIVLFDIFCKKIIPFITIQSLWKTHDFYYESNILTIWGCCRPG